MNPLSGTAADRLTIIDGSDAIEAESAAVTVRPGTFPAPSIVRVRATVAGTFRWSAGHRVECVLTIRGVTEPFCATIRSATYDSADGPAGTIALTLAPEDSSGLRSALRSTPVSSGQTGRSNP